jgi:plastocyanin
VVGDAVPSAIGLAVGIAFVAIFSIIFADASFDKTPAVSTVIIVENAHDAQNGGYEPQIVKVKIGINNTVRWISHDMIPHGIPTPDDEKIDPDFFRAVMVERESHPFLMPGDSFEYTFTHPGLIEYHMVPHPQMKGAVIVLPALP